MLRTPEMSTTVLAHKQFIDDLESLDKSLRKRFARLAPVFYDNPFDSQLSTEKLHRRVGDADVYSCRLNKAYRFIWTSEFSPSPTLRLVGAHDMTYRRAEKMLPLQRGKIRPIKEMLSEPSGSEAPSAVTVSRANCSTLDLTLAEQLTSDSDVFRFSKAEFDALLKGNIASWMLFIAAPHKEFVERAFNGPARVAGPAGSGKTALLLHRAVYEAKRGINAKVLVVCYNVSLAHVLSVLLDRLCGDDWETRARIHVSHLDRLAREICGQRSIVAYKQLLAEACNRVNPKRLNLHFQSNILDFLEKEISIWIKGNPDSSLDAYRNLKFPKSHVPLSEEEREEVVCVAEEYERIKGPGLDWEDLRNHALGKLREVANHPLPGVTAVLVDEYQDFSVSALKLIMELAKPCRQNTFFCGDERQRIYCTNSSFRQLGIEVRGRALVLDANYRNTRQIAQVASHLAKALEADESEGTTPPDQVAYPVLEGPLPVLAGFTQQEAETEWAMTQIQDLLADGYLPGEIGVLTPNWIGQSACAAALRGKRIPHFILKGESATRFFEDGAVKLSTYHQAKGLEYKVVFCCGLSSALFRGEFRYSGAEGKATLGSLLYMAVTRARDRLFLSFAGTPLKWLCTLDHALVELQGEADLLILGAQEKLPRTTSELHYMSGEPCTSTPDGPATLFLPNLVK